MRFLGGWDEMGWGRAYSQHILPRLPFFHLVLRALSGSWILSRPTLLLMEPRLLLGDLERLILDCRWGGLVGLVLFDCCFALIVHLGCYSVGWAGVVAMDR